MDRLLQLDPISGASIGCSFPSPAGGGKADEASALLPSMTGKPLLAGGVVSSEGFTVSSTEPVIPLGSSCLVSGGCMLEGGAEAENSGAVVVIVLRGCWGSLV